MSNKGYAHIFQEITAIKNLFSKEKDSLYSISTQDKDKNVEPIGEETSIRLIKLFLLYTFWILF